MRGILLLLLCCSLGLSAAPHRVVWLYSWGDAMKDAGRARRPIVLMFYIPGHQQCGRIDRETWEHPSIIHEAQKWVAVRLDAEREFVLANKYRIEGYPTMLVVDTYGREWGRLVGFHTPSEMHRFLKSQLHQHKLRLKGKKKPG